MTVAETGMRAMSLEVLQEMYAADEASPARAEAARRDRIDKMQRAQKAIRDEWEEAAYAQYLEADQACRGELLSKAGKAAVTHEFSLWRHSTADAMRYASPELLEFWESSPRVTVREYMRQRARSMRLARADTATKEAGSNDREHVDRETAVGGDAARGVRHERTAGAVQRARDARLAEAGAGEGKRAGSVRRTAGRMRVGGEAMDGTARVVAGGSDANPRQAVTGTVVRRPATPPARRPADGIPGDQLLDLLRNWLGTYARFPSPAALDLVTLWAAHTHVRDDKGKKLLFRATPRLWVLSNEPDSGKSRVLELLNLICPEAYGLSLETTVAGLVKSVKNGETFFIDEGDILFNTGKRHSGVRAIMNGGYTPNGTYPTAKGREPVFGPIAMCGLDVLEKDTGNALNALLSRGFKIRMRQVPKTEPKANRPAKITRRTEAEGAQLKVWLSAWAAQIRDSVPSAEPVMPDELANRAEQISEPLVIVGDAASADLEARRTEARRRGEPVPPVPEDGGWGPRSRAACVELALAQDAAPVEEDESPAEAFASFATDLAGSLAGAVPDDTEDDYDDGEV